MLSIDFVLNGHRYTNDPAIVLSANIPPEYQFIGYNAILALESYAIDTTAVGGGTTDDAAASAIAAAASAVAAAASAASAVSAPGTSATSSTSATIAPGLLTIFVQTGKEIKNGMSVKIAITAASSNWMHGDVQSYNSGTGELVVDVTRTQGSGTSTAWTVSLSSPSYQNGALGGASNLTNATTVTLTASSNHYQRITTVAAGGDVILPDATTLPVGDHQYQIDCTGGITPIFGDVRIKSNTGVLLGFLTPGMGTSVNLSDNSTAAGVWTLPGATPIGNVAKASRNFSSSVGGTAGTFLKVVKLDANRDLLLVYGTTLHCVVYDASTGGFSNSAQIRTGLSTAGAEGTVTAILTGTDTTMVLSCPDGGTAIQAVTITTSGTATPSVGTPTPITAGAAVAKLQDLVAVGTSYVLSYMNGTTSFRTIALTAGATPAAGTEVANATVGPGAVLVASSTVMMVVTSTATTVVSKAYTITGTAQAAGSTATLTTTTPDSISIRLTSAGRWLVTHRNTSARCAFLTIATTVPAFSAATVASSTVTTINTNGVTVSEIFGSSISGVVVAIAGTDSTGRFVCEFVHMKDSLTGAPTLGNANVKATNLAATISYLGFPPGGAGLQTFQVTTAKEMLILSYFAVSGINLFLRGEMRTGVVQGFLPPVQDVTSLINARPRNLLQSMTGINDNIVVVGDGSKQSLWYSFEAYLTQTAKPVPIVQDAAIYAGKCVDPSELWIAYNQAPETNVILQKVKIA